ncbi:hypothetical protein BHE74_00011522 [Ensete ventricosum]|nr:hypothetical protein BHE74_00011522 [Ensete ventricosum]
MDLDDLRGMPKVSRGKTLTACSAASTQGVGEVPPTEAPRSSSKRSSDALVPSDDPSQRHKKVKILSRRHKSHHGEGGSRSHSKGKESAEPVEEPETLVESAEEDASPFFHHPRSGSSGPRQGDASQMGEAEELDEGLERPVDHGGVREGTLAPAVGAGAVYAPIGSTAGLSHQGDGAGNLSTLIFMTRSFFRFFPDDCFMDYRITSLQQEIDALKSGGGRRTQGDLSKVQRLLKETRVKARKMDDELLQSMKALESARAELPRQAVDNYKESTGFKEGLKRMGRVTYEYGYRVALARFRSLHPDSEVEEDPFTVKPEDDSVPMERQ